MSINYSGQEVNVKWRMSVLCPTLPQNSEFLKIISAGSFFQHHFSSTIEYAHTSFQDLDTFYYSISIACTYLHSPGCFRMQNKPHGILVATTYLWKVVIDVTMSKMVIK